MLFAVVGFSVIPLLVASGNGANSPFLFSAGLRLGLGLGHVCFLSVVFGSVLLRSGVLSLIFSRVLKWSMLFVLINQFEYGLFAWATRFVDISVAAVLFETWPILLILLTAFLFRGEVRYRKITPDMILLLVIGFCGFAFVAASQSGGFGDWNSSMFLDTLIGLAIVLMAVIVSSFSAFGFRWGSDLSRALPPEIVGGRNQDLTDICCVLIASCIGNFVGSGLNAIVGLASGETIPSGAIVIAVVGGIFAHASANIAWRSANLMTDNLGINAISYATPIFSLVWLFLFAEVDVARLDYLLIGAAAIITANLLINFEAEIEFGFKALILSLWACGAVVYLRPEEWVWVGSFVCPVSWTVLPTKTTRCTQFSTVWTSSRAAVS